MASDARMGSWTLSQGAREPPGTHRTGRDLEGVSVPAPSALGGRHSLLKPSLLTGHTRPGSRRSSGRVPARGGVEQQSHLTQAGSQHKTAAASLWPSSPCRGVAAQAHPDQEHTEKAHK